MTAGITPEEFSSYFVPNSLIPKSAIASILDYLTQSFLVDIYVISTTGAIKSIHLAPIQYALAQTYTIGEPISWGESIVIIEHDGDVCTFETAAAKRGVFFQTIFSGEDPLIKGLSARGGYPSRPEIK